MADTATVDPSLDDLPGYFDPAGSGPPRAGGDDLLSQALHGLAGGPRRPAPPRPPPSLPATRAWPDRGVRRVLRVPFGPARIVLVDAVLGAVAVLAGATDRPGFGRLPAVRRLRLQDRPVFGADGDVTVRARLRVRWRLRPTRVDVFLGPWSRTRCELRVQLRPRRRHHLSVPQRFYDAAHPAADDLQVLIEAALSPA